MKILYIDDNLADFELAKLAMKDVHDLEIEYVDSFEKFKLNYIPNKYSAIISDYNLYDVFGTELLEYVRKIEKDIPFVMVSGAIGEQKAVDLLRQGATDYVLKDNINKLSLVLQRSLKEAEILKLNRDGVEKLKENEFKYRTLFNQARIGMAQIETASGRFIKVNEKYSEIVGYSEEEMSQLDFMKITHPDDLKEDLQNMEKLINGDIEGFTMEKRLIAKDNSIVWVNLTVSPMWKVKEKPDFHIALVEDITDKKNAEINLKKAEEKYRTLIEQMNDSVVMIDLLGTITFVNQKFISVSGFSKEELIGKNANDVFIASELKTVLNEKIDSRKEGKSDLYEASFYNKAGQKITVKNNASPIYEDGKIIGSISIIRDVTEEKIGQQQDSILNAISRELNNDISIIDFLKIIQVELNTILPAENFYVAINNIKTNELNFIYGTVNNEMDEDIPFKRSGGNGLSEYVVREKKVLHLNGQEINNFQKRNGMIIYRQSAKSWLGVPIKQGEDVIGILSIQSYTNGNAYSEKNKDFVSIIGTQIGAFIVKKQTEKLLIENEAKYRKVVEDQTEYICRWKPDGQIVFANSSYLRFLGITEEKLYERNYFSLVPETEKERFYRKIGTLSVNSPVKKDSHSGVKSNGELYWHEWFDRAFFDENGNISEYQSVGRDITIKKLAEIEIKKSEEFKESVLTALSASIAVVDSIGEVISINDNWAKYAENSNANLVSVTSGFNFFEHCDKLIKKGDPYAAKTLEGFDKVLSRKLNLFEIEYNFINRESKRQWVLIRITPFNGEVGGALISHIDITEKKKKESYQRALFSIANYSNKKITINSFCEFIHFELSKIIDAKSFFVALNEPEKNLLKFPYSSHVHNGVLAVQKDYEKDNINSVAEFIIDSKKPLLLDNIGYSKFLDLNPEIKFGDNIPLSFMGAPLVIDNMVLGVIAVQSFDNDNAYSYKELDLLSFIAEQVATAIYRIQTQSNLIESEEKFRKIFESISDVYYQADMNGIITLMSPSCLPVLGYEPNEVIGKPVASFYENPNLRAKFLEELLKHGKIENYETTLVGRGDSKMIVRANISLRYNKLGEPIGLQGLLNNITEKKKQEQKLINSERLLKEAQQIAKLGSWEWNTKTSKITFSDEMYSILEINPESFDNNIESLKEIIHPLSANRFLEVLDNAVNNFKSVDVELKVITKTGAEKTLLLRASNQIQTVDTAILIHGTIIDISEIKKSINLVIKSEEKFRKIFETITDVYYQADINGIIKLISPSCFKLSGYKVEELLDTTLISLFENPKTKKLIFKNILQKKNIDNLETQFISKNGELIYVSANINLIIDDNGLPIGTQGVIRDISKNKKHEDELEQSLKLNKGIINATDQLFYVVKVEDVNNKINPLTYISPQSVLFYGLTPAEIIANPEIWFNCIHPDDIKNVIKQTKLLFKIKEPITRIYRIIQFGNEEEIWVEDYVYPILNEFGEIQELYGSINNITPLKNKEIELQKLIKELTNKYNELTQFNYIVSHNLRSPIATILGLSNLLDNNLLSGDDKDMAFVHIKDQILKMDDLIKDLNTVLATRSSLNTKRQKVNLSVLINSITETLESHIFESNCLIQTDLSDDSVEFFTIKSYIESILYNLISNAIKYKSAINKPVIIINSKRENENIILTVSDNGSGIDMDLNGKYIFGLYRRFHIEQEGKGLGLHMTKTQVEALGGTITVNSKINVGTTFTVTIPISFKD